MKVAKAFVDYQDLIGRVAEVVKKTSAGNWSRDPEETSVAASIWKHLAE